MKTIWQEMNLGRGKSTEEAGAQRSVYRGEKVKREENEVVGRRGRMKGKGQRKERGNKTERSEGKE